MLMCWVTNDNIRSLRGQDFRKTLHLWGLADKLCLGNLKNYVMDTWRENDDSIENYYVAEEFRYIFKKTASKSLPRQYATRMLRFQSLKSPANGRGCSIDCHGEPIPLSDVDVAALTKLLAKNEEILESYLEVAGREHNASGNVMGPRVFRFY